MGTKKCCVGGCNATSETHRLFSFPKNDELRNLWMSFLVPTNSLLIGLSKEQLLRKRVCEKHFDKYQFDHDGKRLRYSYPCLLSHKEIAHGVPLSVTGWNVTLEHNYSKEQDEDGAGPSTLVTITGRNNTNEHDYFKEQDENNVTKSTVVTGSAADIGKFPEHPSCSSFPTDTSNIDLKDLMLEQPLCSGMSHAINTEVVLRKAQTPKRTSKSTKILLFAGTAVRKIQCNRKFIKNVTQIAKENSSQSAAQRLTKALHIDKEQLFHKFNLLNRQARTFLFMQLRQVQKSKMARRFSLEEKLLALLLMKQSPKGYRLLEKMFALPNKRTLIRLSEKVSMEPGLNPQIFEHISRTCQNWDNQQKLCTVVFDEVAITPHLTFSEKKDKIVGFVDLAGERKLKYSDHALVFMVRGICSPWRQTIAYYFCEGTVSAAELQNILKQIVSQIGLTGLIPLGLVCDQGSTFRTALKILRADTVKSRNIQCIHDDGSVNISGYDMSVFHDPPHLLKGLRNNFMTKDILWEGKTASWKDIEFVFDIDSKLGHTKALPKLTAHHVDPSKMKK
ncbi:hypothetical protein HF086_011250 [Spodoptera exigua]|uniref:THAP-type domain-containing protein n=1 Tax=Spodoptera exigua TaxID=7107 RepID=A0A922SGT1_SPOEX|nr:hypothetical protein HF086_011250 [Spodoptera exigua]